MKTRIVRMGNSRGIRLPKPLIEEAGLVDEVELHVRDGAIIISPTNRPRARWEAAARRLRERNEEGMDILPTPTQFDEKEWEW